MKPERGEMRKSIIAVIIFVVGLTIGAGGTLWKEGQEKGKYTTQIDINTEAIGKLKGEVETLKANDAQTAEMLATVKSSLDHLKEGQGRIEGQNRELNKLVTKLFLK